MKQQTKQRISAGVFAGGAIGGIRALRRRAKAGRVQAGLNTALQYARSEARSYPRGARDMRAAAAFYPAGHQMRALTAEKVTFRHVLNRARPARHRVLQFKQAISLMGRARSRAGLAALGFGALAGAGYAGARKWKKKG